MSSFIVSQKCMNNIINGLFWNHDFKRLYGSTLERKGYSNSKDFQRLGDDLYNLNALGTGTRYGDEKLLYTIQKFKWNSNSPVNKFQVLKSMHCLRYQCSEDEADEKELYKFLTELISYWESWIISEIPEYNKSEWD